MNSSAVSRSQLAVAFEKFRTNTTQENTNALNANLHKQKYFNVLNDIKAYSQLSKQYKFSSLTSKKRFIEINATLNINRFFEKFNYPSNLMNIMSIIQHYILARNIETQLYFLKHPESFKSPIVELEGEDAQYRVYNNFEIMRFNYQDVYAIEVNTLTIINSKEIRVRQLEYLAERECDDWTEETIAEMSIADIWKYLRSDAIQNHITQGVNCNMPTDDGDCACISADFIKESEYNDEQIQDLINAKNEVDDEPFAYSNCSCCFDDDKFLFYGSCRHACVCVDCFVDLLNVRRREVNGQIFDINPSCPICRVPYNIKQKKCIGEKVGLDEESINALYATEEGREIILTLIDWDEVALDNLDYNFEQEYLDDYDYFDFDITDEDDKIDYGELDPMGEGCQVYMYVC